MKIIEKENQSLYGLLIQQSQTLQKILHSSGSLARNNEFQVHFSSLIFRIKDNTEQLDIAIPLVYFNYPQEVSTATIDFDLRDVLAINNKIQELVKLKAEEAKNLYEPIIKKIFNNYEVFISNLNSCHKHP